MSRAIELANTHESDPMRKREWNIAVRKELRRLTAVEQGLADIRALKPTAYYYKYITQYGDEVWSTEIPSGRTASEVVPLYAIKAAK